MYASELIEKLYEIINTCGNDVEVDEKWLRVMLDLEPTINKEIGKPILRIINGK